MTNVYFVQRPHGGKDLSSAQRYGTVMFIIDDPTFQMSQAPGTARKLIEEGLERFDPREDYLVFGGGDPNGALLAGLVYRDFFPGHPLRTLRWERERGLDGERNPRIGFYVPVTLR